MHELDGQQNEIETQKEEGANIKNNDCCNCKEGCVLGGSVYCSIDGRFHPLRGGLICKKFIPNNVPAGIW